jgi:16S rRNA (uracil1498-N3)-methyltransferase
MRIKNNYYRIYQPSQIQEGTVLHLNREDLHYLSIVLKLKNKQIIKVFNEFNGEFLAEFIYDKKNPHLIIIEFLRAPITPKYLHLGICIVKNSIMSDIIDKAVQLGATHITPIISTYTQNREFNLERYSKIAKEAAEQSDRCDMPIIHVPESLENFLKNSFDLILFANETENQKNILDIKKWPEKIALLVGPEGGFSAEEIAKLNLCNNIFSVTLSHNILRSETAVISLLAQISLLR